MTIRNAAALTAVLLASSTMAHAETTVTIATVNNGDMIRMQALTDDFKKDNPGVELNWVILD